jgi:two-component system, cell cycle sensor histidine kinase and response regulator CckA
VRCRRDGSPVIVELMAAPVHACDEHIGDYVSYRDVSERKRAEEALRESDARHTLIADNVSDSIWLMDLNFKMTWASRSVERNRGYSFDELCSLPLEKLLAPASLQIVLKTIREELTPERLQQKDLELSKTLDLEFCKKDGSTYWNEVTMKLLRDQEGTPIGILGVGRDIERRRMKEALRESEEKYRLFVESAGEGILLTQEGRVRYVNPRALEFIGYSQEEFMALSMFNFVHPDDKEMLTRLYLSKLAGEEVPPAISWRIIDKGGTVKWVQSRSTLLTWEDKPSLLTFLVDITQQREAEEALREQSEFSRLVIDNAGEGICVCHAAEEFPFVHFTVWNQRMTSITGYSMDEINRMGWYQTMYPDPEYQKRAIARMEGMRSGDNIQSEEWEIIRSDSQKRTLLITTCLLTKSKTSQPYVLAVISDITDRKRAEEARQELEAQLQQAQKMEAIGTLAGGIAHDFNNLLMGIQGRASLVLADMDFSNPLFEHLRGIEEYVRSAADLTKQLLGFARGGKYEVKATDLNELTDRNANLFGRTKKEITIHRKFQPGLWTVEVDRRQIEQVLLNLFVNAWQAMPAGGEIYLETKNVVLDEAYVKAYGMKTGEYVKISVMDTGMGMDEYTKQRLFDPFFTTKGMGRGTGLGLASAYGIIKNHEGIITVYSEKGHGSTFNIYLPASRKGVSEEKELLGDLVEGEGTILLVDDEDLILEIGKPLLERLGYEVLLAKGGKEAIEVYQGNMNLIKIVILDMIMPKMSGGETFDRLRAINPQVKVLLSSGYSINGQAQEILKRGCHGFIQKPFNLRELSQRMGELLGKP